jgi:hypothetical protein
VKWVRCPKCRTINDIDRYAMCDGCDADLARVAPAADPRRQGVQWVAERDSRNGSRVGWVIAFLALGSTFVLPVGVSVLSALVSFVTLTILFLNFGLRSIASARIGTLLKVMGVLLTIAGALFGAGLLVAIACSVNLSGVRLGG